MDPEESMLMKQRCTTKKIRFQWPISQLRNLLPWMWKSTYRL